MLITTRWGSRGEDTRQVFEEVTNYTDKMCFKPFNLWQLVFVLAFWNGCSSKFGKLISINSQLWPNNVSFESKLDFDLMSNTIKRLHSNWSKSSTLSRSPFPTRKPRYLVCMKTSFKSNMYYVYINIYMRYAICICRLALGWSLNWVEKI